MVGDSDLGGCLLRATGAAEPRVGVMPATRGTAARGVWHSTSSLDPATGPSVPNVLHRGVGGDEPAGDVRASRRRLLLPPLPLLPLAEAGPRFERAVWAGEAARELGAAATMAGGSQYRRGA